MDATLPREPEQLGELTHDAIAGEFRIWQRRDGHRYSLDDVLTARVAAQAKPDAARVLELGSGVGSVLLMLCHKLPGARFLAVEAQRNSFALLRRNVADNALEERVALLHGDLRYVLQRAQHGAFDLITGTPPYVPPGQATPSPDSQRAFARQELRGGVEDYLAAAGRMLARNGCVVLCADARTPERTERAAQAAELALVSRLDALPRAGKSPLFSVFTLRPRSEHQGPCARDTFVARSPDGARTEAYHALREFFGIARPRASDDSHPGADLRTVVLAHSERQGHTPAMRVDAEPLDPFLQLMQRYRPCPGCGSERVTVQRLGSRDTDPLRVSCADCGLSRVTPTSARQPQNTSPGDS